MFDARNILAAEFPLSEVIEYIQDGGVIIHPTETVYGLGGVPERHVIDRMVSLKKRTSSKPMLLLVPDRNSAEELHWTQEASALADAFWPGPLTIVLADIRSHYCSTVRNSKGGVAVRVSPHPLVEILVRELGHPIVSTSANVSGDCPPLEINKSEGENKLFLEEDIWALDFGRLPYSLPSTVIDCSQGIPKIIREGAIPLSEIARLIPKSMKIHG